MLLETTLRRTQLYYEELCLFVRSNIKYLLPVSCITAVCSVMPMLKPVYYLTPVFIMLYIIGGVQELIKDTHYRKVLLSLVAFGLWCLTTTFWSDYPCITARRSLYFLLISVGGVTGSYLWKKHHKDDISFLIPANIFVIITCLISLIFSVPSDAWSGGHGKGFMAFFKHQNTLGALILFTLMGVINELLTTVNKDKKYLIILLLFNIIFLLLSYSRASILALIIVTILIIIYRYQLKGLTYITVFTLLILGLINSTPERKDYTEKLLLKGFESILDSRMPLWEASFEAAKEGGFTGIGYGMSHPQIKLPYIGIYENGRYIRESGNSILALIEQIGLIGFTLFFFFCFFNFFIRKPYYLIIFTGVFLHSLFEGWLQNVADPFFFFLFFL